MSFALVPRVGALPYSKTSPDFLTGLDQWLINNTLKQRRAMASPHWQAGYFISDSVHRTLAVENSHTTSLLYLERCIKKLKSSTRQGLFIRDRFCLVFPQRCVTHCCLKQQYIVCSEATAYTNICSIGGDDSIKTVLGWLETSKFKLPIVPLSGAGLRVCWVGLILLEKYEANL